MIEADIKWPNVFLVNEKKICGILCETVETPGGLAVIVGIGIKHHKRLSRKCDLDRRRIFKSDDP